MGLLLVAAFLTPERGTTDRRRTACRYAVVAGERASHLTLVAVGEDGSLRTVQEIATGAGSNWVRTLPRA